jgi:1,4-alpha-glucan branching enzyme
VQGYLSLILHAHLPLVRHPEHERFLEESWLFEAITETYIPLLLIFERWHQQGLSGAVTLTLTPTLCSMLQDPLLQERYTRHLDELIELADKEVYRTHWQGPVHELALFYYHRFNQIRDAYLEKQCNLVAAFARLQEEGGLEIITSAATHAVLPLLAPHPGSLRAQVLVACDHYQTCFGRSPRGIWLPECAYDERIEPVLSEARLRWFILDTHGILRARPRPRYSIFAPIATPAGLAAFGRDPDSARQVWSREGGYPGDPRYRDFYRDIAFDLDLDYLRPHLAAGEKRTFTGIKYHRITGQHGAKEPYDRNNAIAAADGHASHFLTARTQQVEKLAGILEFPPLIVAPFDAELFGHWWYEGPEFLDFFVRKAAYDQNAINLITPEQYLAQFPTHQRAAPSPSSWGEAGYWRVWLNEKNEWIFRHLNVAQERMTELARRFAQPETGRLSCDGLAERALKQAARELLLAQASDWPFILRTGTSPDYATKRVQDHLLRFTRLYEQLAGGGLDETWLAQVEAQDNVFPNVDFRYWT